MLYSGKKIRALRDKTKISCPKKKPYTPLPLCKLNGRSLNITMYKLNASEDEELSANLMVSGVM